MKEKAKYILKSLMLKIVESTRKREPEKIVFATCYVANLSMVVLQFVALRWIGGERHLPIAVASVLLALQFYLPFILLDRVPPYHLIAVSSFTIAGLVTRLVEDFVLYYYIVSLSLPVSVLKLDLDVSSLSPLFTKISVKATRAMKKARPPRSREELKLDIKLSSVYVFGIAVSVVIYLLTSQIVAVLVAIYNALVSLGIISHVAAIPVRTGGEKYSLAMLLVMRYPSLYRLANHMKMKLHPLVERSGRLIYELKFLSKFVVALVMYAMFLPTIALSLFVLVPPPWFYLTIPVLLLVAILIYQLPFIIVKSYIGSRKRRVEKEYPFFVAYVTAMISSGLNLYQAMIELASARGQQLLRAFSDEAKIIKSLVERQGMPELKALEYYASVHPSDEVRNFVLGYIYQTQMGGRIVFYLEQKLNEAIDVTKRKLEAMLRNILMLTEIAILVLVIPVLPMVLGFILAPDLVYSLVVLHMVAITPAVSVMFFNAATMIQPPYRNIYVFKYVYSIIFGVAGLVVSTLVLKLPPLVSVATVMASIALGHYIEYLRQQKEFSDIEKAMPDFFRDLAELRNLMSIPEALRRMTTMNYPKGMRDVIGAWVRLRDLGMKLSEQPWHSRSWFMRFAQFIVGKIEDFGGGTPQLFRILMGFFTEYKNIMMSLRSNLRIYEVVVWIVPVLLGVVIQIGIGIFNVPRQILGELNIPNTDIGVIPGMEFTMRMFGGIDPFVLLLCDIIIIENALVLGLLTGKITGGTIHNTKNLFISLLITAIVLMVAPQIIEQLSQTIAGTP